MGTFTTGLTSLLTTYQGYVVALAGVALFIIGILIAAPWKETKEAGKKHLAGVIIGVGIALTASAIATEIGNSWGF